MPDKSYRIIYQGKVAQGRTVEEVKRNLASLFKLSAEKTAQLFSGKRVVIAKNVAYTSAMRYKMAFETAGGICKVEEVNSELRLVPPLEMEKDEASKSEPGKAITCPKCGFKQEKAEECIRCAIIISNYSENPENEKEMPYVTTRRARPRYFGVSKLKLVVMSLITFGIYEIYWFYKNWELIKITTRQNIRPFWRAVFAIFFCYSLFRRVQDSASSHGCRASISPGWLTACYIILSATWDLPDPFWLIPLFSFLPLLPVQGAINEINAKAPSTAAQNTGYCLSNVQWA